jgi:hypothetical protein
MIKESSGATSAHRRLGSSSCKNWFEELKARVPTK